MIRRRQTKVARPVAKNCPFCAAKTDVVWDDLETISRYLSDRGKIMPRSRTGLCAKHQRQITRSVKWNRHLALLPFTKTL